MYKKKVRFTATLTGLLMTGFLVTSLISYNVAKNSLTRTILGETLPLTSDNIYSGVMQDLLRPITIASTMSGNTFVRTWLETGEQPIQAITDYLAGIEQRFGAVTAFLASERTRTYYDSSGLVRTFDPADPANVWYSHPDTSEPFNTVGHKAEISVDTDTTDRNRFDIVVSFPVWGSHGVFLGVSGVSLGLDSVRPLLADYEQRYDREIYLVDRQGQVQLHSSRLHSFDHLRDRSENEALVQAVLGDPTAQLQFRDPLGETVYLNSRLIPELDWFLIVEQVSRRDEATLLGTLIGNLLIALAVSAVVLLLVWATLGKYQRQLMTMATTDALTGTVSRQAFDELFEHAVQGVKRRRQDLSLLLIDLDHFKQVNDRFGHQVGDEVLKSVAELLSSVCRASDILCRWGGEEFLVLMEGCGLEDATQRAGAIRRTVANRPVRMDGRDIRVTLSIGVAEYAEGDDLHSLVNRADNALYAAKRGGRDRVELAV